MVRMVADVDNFAVGDRVVLVNCSSSPGTVLEQRRDKLLVRFDDLPAVKWVLCSTSLKLAIDRNSNSRISHTKGFTQ
jgi:hypothetical protein